MSEHVTQSVEIDAVSVTCQNWPTDRHIAASETLREGRP